MRANCFISISMVMIHTSEFQHFIVFDNVIIENIYKNHEKPVTKTKQQP